MPNRWIIFLKVLAHIACLAPVAWLVWHLIENNLGPDPTAAVTFFTGRGTLRLLMLSLAITPVRRIVPKLSWLIRFRRMLGLYAFFYACLHLATYIALYAGFSWSAMVDDIQQRRFITAGVLAWLLLLPLALTSTKWAVRKLGGKRWQALHRLVYLAAFAGIVHYWWGVKQGVLTPTGITAVFLVLMLVRPVTGYLSQKRQQKARLA